MSSAATGQAITDVANIIISERNPCKRRSNIHGKPIDRPAVIAPARLDNYVVWKNVMTKHSVDKG